MQELSGGSILKTNDAASGVNHSCLLQNLFPRMVNRGNIPALLKTILALGIGKRKPIYRSARQNGEINTPHNHCRAENTGS